MATALCAPYAESSGPASVLDKDSPLCDPTIYDLEKPILGICYGMQFMVHLMGGSVKKSAKREYGFAQLDVTRDTPLFNGTDSPLQCWMSHGDSITALPPGFVSTAQTANTPVAAMADPDRRIFGLQFHPEVEHTPAGKRMLKNFLFDICACKRLWTMKA